MNLIYKVGTASREQMYTLLQACDQNFAPRLSSRVNLLDYANKIYEKAVSFEAWDGDALVGMMNGYFNDMSTLSAYFTHISILKEYMGKRIGSTLMKMGLEHAWRLGFKRARAEMSRNNVAIHRLVARAGFRVVDDSGEWLQIECEPSSHRNEEPQ